MENRLSSSGMFSQDLRHWRSSKLSRKTCNVETFEPEKFEDRITFMSMFNDIEWTQRGNSEKFISNSELVKSYAKRFSRGHWTFLGPGDEKKWYGSVIRLKENEILPPHRWWNDSKKQVIQYSRASILKRKSNWDTVHFSADASNTELFFRTILSANHFSIYGAVSSWFEEFVLETDCENVFRTSKHWRKESNF